MNIEYRVHRRRIHERIISFRFLIKILRAHRLEVSVHCYKPWRSATQTGWRRLNSIRNWSKKIFCHLCLNSLLRFPSHWHFPAVSEKKYLCTGWAQPSTFRLPSTVCNVHPFCYLLGFSGRICSYWPGFYVASSQLASYFDRGGEGCEFESPVWIWTWRWKHIRPMGYILPSVQCAKHVCVLYMKGMRHDSHEYEFPMSDCSDRVSL